MKSSKKKTNTERKRHPAKGRSKDSASAPSPSSRRGAKREAKPAPKKVAPKKAAKKPVKKAVKKVAPKAKPAPKKVAKKVAPKKAVKAKPAKKATAKKAVKAPAKKPAKKVAPKKVAKKAAKKATKKAKPAKKPVKKAAKVVAKPTKKVRGRPAKVATEKPSKTKRHPAKEAKPAEIFRPRRNTGALIISKRGRKSKKERAAAEAQSIFVPRDVKAENTEENQIRDARAYSPDELEQLLMTRGVSNMNVFDPKTAPTTKQNTERKRHPAKVILTTLPKAKKRQTVGPVSVSDLFGFNPFSKNSASQEEKLIPEKWRKYYRKLIERKDALLARLSEHSEKAFQKESKEETGDVSAYSQHTADIDSDAFDRDVALSRLPAEQEELSEINIAIDRMKKGTYGICEITGKPIPAERLNKVPFTRYSIEGKLEAEKQRGLAARRRRANATGDISEVIDLENDAPVQLPEEENEEQ